MKMKFVVVELYFFLKDSINETTSVDSTELNMGLNFAAVKR